MTSLLAVALTAACSPQRVDESSDDGGAEYGAVCADPQTQERLDDDDCDDDPSHQSRGSWYFIPVGRPYPAKGQKISGGSFTQPFGGSTVKYGGASATGGTATSGGRATTGGGAESGSVSRGGFGGKTGGSGS
ncbi:hypothetical protein [Micromonospora pattaloongensis]|uniref:hypothetical protein n=1 Tax=Micromonospora pattaloongensis TaxID=405436 RepID=UPI00158709ED|nr:hypothetical protein [Micromonospora pattaloongensis]